MEFIVKVEHKRYSYYKVDTDTCESAMIEWVFGEKLSKPDDEVTEGVVVEVCDHHNTKVLYERKRLKKRDHILSAAEEALVALMEWHDLMGGWDAPAWRKAEEALDQIDQYHHRGTNTITVPTAHVINSAPRPNSARTSA